MKGKIAGWSFLLVLVALLASGVTWVYKEVVFDQERAEFKREFEQYARIQQVAIADLAVKLLDANYPGQHEQLRAELKKVKTEAEAMAREHEGDKIYTWYDTTYFWYANTLTGKVQKAVYIHQDKTQRWITVDDQIEKLLDLSTQLAKMIGRLDPKTSEELRDRKLEATSMQFRISRTTGM